MRQASVCLAILLVFPVLALEGESFKITDHTINAGGNTAVVLASSSYRLTLSAVGDAVIGPWMSSAAYTANSGFASGYPAPGEVHDLLFTGKQALVWTAEPSAGEYDLYRAALDDIVGSGHGACYQLGIPHPYTTEQDSPSGGDGYFYLVTVKNRLEEAGTKGWDSAGIERPTSDPCP
jgi:hypothetical protein